MSGWVSGWVDGQLKKRVKEVRCGQTSGNLPYTLYTVCLVARMCDGIIHDGMAVLSRGYPEVHQDCRALVHSQMSASINTVALTVATVWSVSGERVATKRWILACSEGVSQLTDVDVDDRLEVANVI